MDKIHWDFLWNRRAFCGVSTFRYGDTSPIKNKTTCKRCQKMLRADGYRGKFKNEKI